MMHPRLADAARRAEARPFFVAYHLARTRTGRGWTDADMAAFLGIDAEALARLALCRHPRTGAELARIAAGCGIDPDRLAEALDVERHQ